MNQEIPSTIVTLRASGFSAIQTNTMVTLLLNTFISAAETANPINAPTSDRLSTFSKNDPKKRDENLPNNAVTIVMSRTTKVKALFIKSSLIIAV